MTGFGHARATRAGTVAILGGGTGPVARAVERAAAYVGLDVLHPRSGNARLDEVQVAEIVVLPIDEDDVLPESLMLVGAAHVLGKKVLTVVARLDAMNVDLAHFQVLILDDPADWPRLADELTRLRAEPIVERTVVPLPGGGGHGEQLDGEVVTVQANVAVVRTADGREGLLVPDDVSWTRKVRDLRRVLRPGQVVHGVLFDGGEEGGRFSMRALQADPWPALERVAGRPETVEGVVHSFEPRIGVFVTLEGSDVNGLVPRSKLPDGLELEPGERVTVLVEHVDRDVREVGLRLVSVSPPDREQAITHAPGDRLVGTVAKVDAERGYALVELPDGFTAILPFRRLSSAGRDAVVSGRLRPGVRLPVTIVEVDHRRRRVELTDAEKGWTVHEGGESASAPAMPETAQLAYDFLQTWAKLEPFVLTAERVPRELWARPFPIRFSREQESAIATWMERNSSAVARLRFLQARVVHGVGEPLDISEIHEGIDEARALLDDLRSLAVPDVAHLASDAGKAVVSGRTRRNPYSLRLGARIRGLRTARHLTMEQLGELADVHRTFVGHVERGEVNPTLSSIVRLAIALGVDPAELVAGLHDPGDHSGAQGSLRG